MLHRSRHHRTPWASRISARALVSCCLCLVVDQAAHAAPSDAGVDAAAPDPFGDPFTAREREKLRVRIRPLTVIVRRKGTLPEGMWAPGGASVEVHGWWAGARRVVTASPVVEGWPRTRRDRIEVETSDGRRFEAAVGLDEAALGLAVLDVPELPAPALPAAAGAADIAVAPGRPLYAADGSGLLHRVIVDRPAFGQAAYYFRLLGGLAPGTPLFDAKGRVVSLVGRRGAEPLTSLALPAKALRALLERDDWTL